MAKKDSIGDELNKALSIGRTNQDLVPSIKNWCRHIVLSDRSAGMVAEIYRLPMNIHISCAHATGQIQGMKLGWIAADFIKTHCVNCTFHEPVNNENFGTRVLEEMEQQATVEKTKMAAEQSLKDGLKKKIDELSAKLTPGAPVTELSILKYVRALYVPEEKMNSAGLLMEAARLDPVFFSTQALENMLLFITDMDCGATVTGTIETVIASMDQKPEFVFEAALTALPESPHINAFCGLLQQYLNKSNLASHKATIRLTFDKLSYMRFPGEPLPVDRAYEKVKQFFSFLIGEDREFMKGFFNEILSLSDLKIRVNINGLLQDLFAAQSLFVCELVPKIIKSIEGPDEASFQSADYSTLQTLVLPIKSEPETYYSMITNEAGKLSKIARNAILPLTGLILKDEDFRRKKPEFCKKLMDDFVEVVTQTPVFDSKECFDELERLSRDYPWLLEDKIDALLGLLMKMTGEEKTFRHYRKEVESKPAEQQLTFNYLVGKTHSDIHLMEMELQRVQREVSNSIGNIMELDPARFNIPVKELMAGLDSAAHEEAKILLLQLIANHTKDPVIISRQIPDLYTNLLDPQSHNVRYAALSMLKKIIETYPQLVTQTLFDLVDIFVADPQTGIRGRAIDIIGTMAENTPSMITQGHKEIMIAALLDQYVFVHKKAVRNIHAIYEMITPEEKRIIYRSLIAMEAIYSKEEDDDFCETIIDQMLLVAEPYPKLYSLAVQNYVVKYCRSSRYHVASNFRKKLQHIKTDNASFENDWLLVAFEFLAVTRSNFPGDDERTDIFAECYQLSYQTVFNSTDLFIKFIATRKDADLFDMVSVLNLLCYFELHTVVTQITASIAARIKQVAATKTFHDFCSLHAQLSDFEISCTTGSATFSQLETIEHAFPE